MDSSLADLDRKGNLDSAPAQYNPNRAFESVLHFTWSPGDVRYQPRFSPWNIDIVPYGQRGGFGVARIAVAFAQVARRLRSARVNVIRGRLPYHGSLVGVLAGRMLGIPSVVSLGGDNRLAQQLTGAYQYNSRRLSFAIEALVLRLATRIIVPNRFTADYVARIIGSARARKKIVEIP